MPSWTRVTSGNTNDDSTRFAIARGVIPVQSYAVELDTRNDGQREAFFGWLRDPLPIMLGDQSGDRYARVLSGIDPEYRTAALEPLDELRIPPPAVAQEVVDAAREKGNATELDYDWRVVTVLRNHHRGLNPRINMMSAAVSYEEETVYVDVYKQLDSSA